MHELIDEVVLRWIVPRELRDVAHKRQMRRDDRIEIPDHNRSLASLQSSDQSVGADAGHALARRGERSDLRDVAL